MKKAFLFSFMTFLLFSVALISFYSSAKLQSENWDYSKIYAIQNVNLQFNSISRNINDFLLPGKFEVSEGSNSTNITFSTILPAHINSVEPFLEFVRANSRFNVSYSLPDEYGFQILPQDITISYTSDGLKTVPNYSDQIKTYEISIYTNDTPVPMKSESCTSPEGVLLNIYAYGRNNKVRTYSERLDPECVSNITVRFSDHAYERVYISFGPKGLLNVRVHEGYEILYSQKMVIDGEYGNINILTTPIHVKLYDGTLGVSKEGDVYFGGEI